MPGPAADEREASPKRPPLLTGDQTLQEELRLRNQALREVGAKPHPANVVAVARPATTTRASSQHSRDSRAAPVRRKGSRRGSRDTRAGPDDPEEPESHEGDVRPGTLPVGGRPPQPSIGPDVAGQRALPGDQRGGSA
jgi:hypothetical protein